MFRCAKHGMVPNFSGLIAALHVVSVAATITFSSLLASFPPLTFLTEKSRLITRDFLIRKRERLSNLTVRDGLTLSYGNLSPARLRSYFPPCTAQFSIDLQTFQITNYKLSWLAWTGVDLWRWKNDPGGGGRMIQVEEEE